MRLSVEEYIAGLPPAQALVVAAVRELVHQAAPEVTESIKWAQPVWEMNGPVCSARAFRNATNVNFWRGAELAERNDPERLLIGEGGRMRHLRLASADDIQAALLVQLVQAAVVARSRFAFIAGSRSVNS